MRRSRANRNVSRDGSCNWFGDIYVVASEPRPRARDFQNGVSTPRPPPSPSEPRSSADTRGTDGRRYGRGRDLRHGTAVKSAGKPRGFFLLSLTLLPVSPARGRRAARPSVRNEFKRSAADERDLVESGVFRSVRRSSVFPRTVLTSVRPSAVRGRTSRSR